MKKFILVLSILFLFFISYDVKADIGPPGFEKKEGIIVNQNGAKCYDWEYKVLNIVIPYNTKVETYYEYKYNDELYIQVSYNNQSYNISEKDFAFLDNEFSLTKATQCKENCQVKVFNKNGIEMFKGPSKLYGSLNITIPYGTELELKYFYNPFVYVTYNGISGWIYDWSSPTGWYDQTYLAHKSDKTVLVVKEKVKFYDKIDFNKDELNGGTEISSTIVKVPVNSKLKCDYTIHIGHDDFCNTKYNNNPGWINIGEINDSTTSEEQEVTLYLYDDINIYDSIENGKVIYTLTKDTFYNNAKIYSYSIINSLNNDNPYLGYNYIEYKDIKGWILDSDNSKYDSILYISKYEAKNDVSIFKDKELTEQIGTIKKGESIYYIGYYSDTINHIYYNDQFGFVNDFYNNFKSTDEPAILFKELYQLEKTNDETNNEKEPTIHKENKSETNNISPKMNIIIAISIGMIIAIISIILLIKINHKKKMKQKI